MFLTRFSKKQIIITIIIITICFTYYLFSKQQLYGNDKKSIEQVINSIEGYENETIEILGMKDIKNDRVVAFLSNNSPAYIQFSKNHNGDYKWRHIEKHSDTSFTPFLINIDNGDTKILKFMVVANQENNIAKMQLGVNDQVIEQEFSVNRNFVYWIDLPVSDLKDKSYTFTYKYFDNEGNRISDK